MYCCLFIFLKECNIFQWSWLHVFFQSLFLVVVALSLATGKPWWGSKKKGKDDQAVDAAEVNNEYKTGSNSDSSSDEDKGKKGKHGKVGGAQVQGGADVDGGQYQGNAQVIGGKNSGGDVEGGYKADSHGSSEEGAEGSYKVNGQGGGNGKFEGSVKAGSGGGSYGVIGTFGRLGQTLKSVALGKSNSKSDENSNENAILGWFNFR